MPRPPARAYVDSPGVDSTFMRWHMLRRYAIRHVISPSPRQGVEVRGGSQGCTAGRNTSGSGGSCASWVAAATGIGTWPLILYLKRNRDRSDAPERADWQHPATPGADSGDRR